MATWLLAVKWEDGAFVCPAGAEICVSPLHLGRLDLTKPLNQWMPGAVYVGVNQSAR